MVRHYVRKMKQASWNETSMKEVILAVKTKKMGLSKASRTFDVPKDSLRRRLQKLEKSNTILFTRKCLVSFEMCCLKAKKRSSKIYN